MHKTERRINRGERHVCFLPWVMSAPGELRSGSLSSFSGGPAHYSTYDDIICQHRAPCDKGMEGI